MKAAAAILAVLALLGAAVYLGSPFLAAQRLQEDVRRGDVADLTARTDLPAVAATLPAFAADQAEAPMHAKRRTILDRLFGWLRPGRPRPLAARVLDGEALRRILAGARAAESGVAAEGYFASGVDLFRVQWRVSGRAPLVLTLERRGFLHWRLISVTPADEAPQ